MKSFSKTTVTGIAMLMIIAACLALLLTGKQDAQGTLVIFGLLTTGIISAIGHFFAADSNAPTTVSETTIEESDKGKVVKVTSQLPPDEVLQMDKGTKKGKK